MRVLGARVGALPEHGELLACDVDERMMEVAREFWEKTGASHKIQEYVAPATLGR